MRLEGWGRPRPSRRRFAPPQDEGGLEMLPSCERSRGSSSPLSPLPELVAVIFAAPQVFGTVFSKASHDVNLGIVCSLCRLYYRCSRSCGGLYGIPSARLVQRRRDILGSPRIRNRFNRRPVFLSELRSVERIALTDRLRSRRCLGS